MLFVLLGDDMVVVKLGWVCLLSEEVEVMDVLCRNYMWGYM